VSGTAPSGSRRALRDQASSTDKQRILKVQIYREERLPLRINSSSWARSSALNRTTYFLTAISFPTTNHLHRCLAVTEIQKLPSFSMTGATRPVRADPNADRHEGESPFVFSNQTAIFKRLHPLNE
jgi:hypothetical protein